MIVPKYKQQKQQQTDKHTTAHTICSPLHLSQTFNDAQFLLVMIYSNFKGSKLDNTRLIFYYCYSPTTI